MSLSGDLLSMMESVSEGIVLRNPLRTILESLPQEDTGMSRASDIIAMCEDSKQPHDHLKDHHKVLASKGFKLDHHEGKKGSVYKSSDAKPWQVTVHHDGSWKSDNAGKSGKSIEDLKKHLMDDLCK
jgi:hypothetical protein